MEKKWYQNKFGWIGAVIGFVLTETLSNYLIFLPNFNIILFWGITYGAIYSAIIGFLIGYFIEKKFFSKKRYSIGGRRGRR